MHKKLSSKTFSAYQKQRICTGTFSQVPPNCKWCPSPWDTVANIAAVNILQIQLQMLVGLIGKLPIRQQKQSHVTWVVSSPVGQIIRFLIPVKRREGSLGSVVLVSACSYTCKEHRGPFSIPENSCPDLVMSTLLTSRGLQKRCAASLLPPGNYP